MSSSSGYRHGGRRYGQRRRGGREIGRGGAELGTGNRRHNVSSNTRNTPVAQRDNNMPFQLTPEEQKFNYYMYEFVVPEGPPPEQPFVMEQPETDEHLKAFHFMRDLKEERQLVDGIHGVMDCRGLHSLYTMCQFCDGRRGPWAKDQTPSRSDDAFQRYQESFTTTFADYRRRNHNDSEDQAQTTLGPEVVDNNIEDIEYGVSSMRLSVAE